MAAGTEKKRTGGHLGDVGTSLLGAYFLAVPVATLWLLYRTYPNPELKNILLLAMIGGALGSYLHSAQSFACYVGNRQARRSWVWWYLLRVPIGACLGVLMVMVIMAGLMGQQTPEPTGVIAFSALAGWFSKQATEKLAELFETLFRAQKPAQLQHPLKVIPQPTILVAVPENDRLVVRGENFEQGAVIRVDDKRVATTFTSDKELTADPLTPGTHSVVVVNPSPLAAPSDPYDVHWPAQEPPPAAATR